jgi:hypothetical protein
MSAKTTTNGQARKSLAEQIDRLDAVLDGLADGLNDAVAAAVKDAVGMAVQQAVQAVMREALANPELLARLGAVAAPAPAPASAAPAPAAALPASPTSAAPEAPKSGWKRRWGSMCRTSAAWAAAVRMECGRTLNQARRGARWVICRLPGRFWTPVLTVLGLGAAIGVGAYFAGPWLAAAAGGVGGLAAAAAARLRTAWERLTTPAVAATG